MVRHIQVHEDKNLQEKLKALAELQDMDKKLAVIKNRVTKLQSTDQTQFVLQDNVLCVLNGRDN
jgi:division protein CdvB (Snf7/Vps24/ESCRT-III family)